MAIINIAEKEETNIEFPTKSNNFVKLVSLKLWKVLFIIKNTGIINPKRKGITHIK